MGNKLATILLMAVGLCAFSIPLFAHHGDAAYDTTKKVVVKGMVTDYLWSNPHVFLKVEAKDDSGNVQHWVIEAQSPVAQSNLGWSRTTFKPGDEVIVDVIPAKNGQSIGRFRGRIVINDQVFKP